MDKRVVYCKKFECKDHMLHSLLGGHPREGYLYKMSIDKEGFMRILVGDRGSETQLYISSEKGEDLRYSFEFEEFEPSLIFREKRIPQATNPTDIEEWLKEPSEPASLANKHPEIFKEVSSQENNEEIDIEDKLSRVRDAIFLGNFIEDLIEFNPSIYEGLMNSIVGINNMLASKKEEYIDLTEIDLARLLNDPSDEDDLNKLTLIHLAIINKFYKEG